MIVLLFCLLLLCKGWLLRVLRRIMAVTGVVELWCGKVAVMACVSGLLQ